MNIDSPELSVDLQHEIESKKCLSLKTAYLNPVAEENLKKVIFTILNKFSFLHLETILYSILKELIINGCKANHKRVFFQEKNLDISNPQSYAEGMKSYKKTLAENLKPHYESECRDKGLFCDIHFAYSENGISVEVMNNCPITREEEIKLREKLSKGMHYNNIVHYFNENLDENEGSGLGLAMIIIMLKNEGYDAGLFRIITDKNKTTARVEFPFTKKYKAAR